MSVLKALCIGDPHIKTDNVKEINIMTEQLVELIIKEDPDFVVILGDTLHKHEDIKVYELDRADVFIEKIWEVSKHLYILIGNHDRPNNEEFLTRRHPFNAYKKWKRMTIVDDVTVSSVPASDGKSYTYLFVPYVKPNRFFEALNLRNVNIYDHSGLFSHQEYKGSNMNKLSKAEADEYPED